MDYLTRDAATDLGTVGQSPTAQACRPVYVRRLEAVNMMREASRRSLIEQVEEAHRALQASLTLLKERIEASDAGLYPAHALAEDLEMHAGLTRRWTEKMGELARFYQASN